jgi:hypothetical protein
MPFDERSCCSCATSKEEGKQLKNMRWPLLRKGSRVRGRARKKLNTLLASKIGYGAGMEIEGVLPSFLDLQVAYLGWRISRRVVHSCPAQPPGADEEGSPNAAVRGSRALQRIRDGLSNIKYR